MLVFLIWKGIYLENCEEFVGNFILVWFGLLFFFGSKYNVK